MFGVGAGVGTGVLAAGVWGLGVALTGEGAGLRAAAGLLARGAGVGAARAAGVLTAGGGVGVRLAAGVLAAGVLAAAGLLYLYLSAK